MCTVKPISSHHMAKFLKHKWGWFIDQSSKYSWSYISLPLEMLNLFSLPRCINVVIKQKHFLKYKWSLEICLRNMHKGYWFDGISFSDHKYVSHTDTIIIVNRQDISGFLFYFFLDNLTNTSAFTISDQVTCVIR